MSNHITVRLGAVGGRWLAWTLSLAPLVVGCGPEQDSEILGGARQEIANGEGTGAYPEVGKITVSGLVDADGNPVSGLATGTLIGCNVLLTCAHCIEGDQNAWVEFESLADKFYSAEVVPYGGGSATQGNMSDRLWNGLNDLALVRLNPPVPKPANGGIAPTHLQDHPQGPDDWATTVGYGCNDRDTGAGSGVKRSRGWTVTDVSFFTKSDIICPGDSGGPTYGYDGVYMVSSGKSDVPQPTGDPKRYDLWAWAFAPDFIALANQKKAEWEPMCGS